MLTDHFPLQAAVMSEDALGSYIVENYFSKNTKLSCRLFWRSIHDVYRIIMNGSFFFYKMYKQGLRSYNEIQSEIDILNHLNMSGIRVVNPIAQKDGNYIGQFKTVFGNRYGVLYESAGRIGLGEVEETALLNNKLGCYIASIHSELDKFNADYDRWNLDTI
jgi:Ser/Thr protein kinase RdoA (MazF antagonist)